MGRALGDALLARGERVRVLDPVPPAEPERVEYVRASVTDEEAVKEACRGCRCVFHLAGKLPQARITRAELDEINVGGTRYVIEGCRKWDVPVIIYASTIEIYGPRTDFPVSEAAEPRFTGPYSHTKWESEALLRRAMEAGGPVFSAMRMPMIFGPGFYHEKAMLELFRSVRRGRIVWLPGARAPFTCVSARDAAEAFIKASAPPAARGESFNIAAADHPSTGRLIRSLVRAAGSTSRVIELPDWLIRPGVRLVERFTIKLPVIETPPELIGYALTGLELDTSLAACALGFTARDSCLEAMLSAYRWLVKEERI